MQFRLGRIGIQAGFAVTFERVVLDERVACWQPSQPGEEVYLNSRQNRRLVLNPDPKRPVINKLQERGLSSPTIRSRKILQYNRTSPDLWLQLMTYGAVLGRLTACQRDLCDDPATVWSQSYLRLMGL
jgi:hypothetical protein